MQSTTIGAPPAVVLIPKNRGLAAMAEYALRITPIPEGSERTFVRGEDVPLLASEVARSGRSLIAFTGEDLVNEWIAGGRTLDARVRRSSIPWNDPNARYGAPALCLIGKREIELPESGTVRIAVCAKYESLARVYLRGLERPERTIETIAISGSVEAALLHSLADAMIDIVVTGSTIDDTDLEVKSVISKSNLAVLEATP